MIRGCDNLCVEIVNTAGSRAKEGTRGGFLLFASNQRSPAAQSELQLTMGQQRLVVAGGELGDTAKPLRNADTTGGPITLHLVPSRASLRKPRSRAGSTASTSGGSGGSSGGASGVAIPRLDFKLITFGESIGTGSYKSVFRGNYGSHRVACLRFRGGEAAAKEAVREARIMARLPVHPSVLRFFGMTQDEGKSSHLVCEYAELGALDAAIDRLPGRRPPWPMVCAIGSQIAAGMAAVAGRGLLHRDLSLRNVLCFRLDVEAMAVLVKVGDFGKALEVGCQPQSGEDVPLRWAAPEVLATKQFSEASDVWSYGVTMWELCNAGAVPFAQHADATIRRTILGARDSGHLLPRAFGCPDAVTGIIQACWLTNPRMRPQFAELEVMMEKAADTVRRAPGPARIRADPLVDAFVQMVPSQPAAPTPAPAVTAAVRSDPLVGSPPPCSARGGINPSSASRVPSSRGDSGSGSTTTTLVAKLMDMGFSEVRAERALADSKNNLELATVMLLSAGSK